MVPIKKDEIKIALIGLGRISRKHIRAIGRLGLDDCVKIICDIDNEKIKKTKEHFTNAICITDWTTIVDEDINFVVIMTPHGFHYEMSKAFLKFGINVLCEKPLAFTEKEVKTLVDMAKVNNVRLFQCFQNRYNPSIKALKRAIDEGRFGEIHLVEIKCLWARPQEYFDLDKWRGTMEHRDGVIYNQSLHFIDLATYLLKPKKIFINNMGWTELKRNVETDMLAYATIYFDKKITVLYTATNCCFRKNIEAGITIIGTKGQARIMGMAANKIEVWEFDDIREADMAIWNDSQEITDVYGEGHYEIYKDICNTWGTDKKTFVESDMFQPYTIADSFFELCN